ncbi:integrase core domain protein, partial [Gregarina niphandrodes]
MIVRIKKHFYWPLLAKDCVDFTAGCLTCQRRMNVVNLVGKGVLLSTDFNILVSVDAIGPFMYKKKSYNLITMIDNLTKWVEVGILEDGTALTAWNLVYSMWICRLGVPMKMLTDNGAMFTGRDFCDKVESLGIRTSNATPQYPQGNSMVESFHHFLKGALSRTSVNNWSFEEVLASVLYAYRSTPHISTGESPYRLLTGNDMVLPHFQAWTNYETLDSRAAHRYSLITQLRYEAFEQAISRQALTSTKKDDRKFELGDVVIYQLTKKDSEKLVKYYGTDKLMPAWSEPMRITKVLHPQQGTYLLESVWHKGFKRQVNKTQLRSFYPMPDPRFDEWYRTEAARDRQYQTQGSAAEQQRRERLETAEKLGVRDER